MEPRSSPLLPIAFVIAVLVIGAAIFLVLRTDDPAGPLDVREAPQVNVRATQESDWVRGNPNAPVTLIVYSDFECPYCKAYHKTIARLINEFGANGDVSWVFRHMPLVQLHSKAPTEALAAECVGSLGGATAFWKFADNLFETTPGNDLMDLSLLPDLAEQAGVDRAQFEACVRSDRLMENVREDFEEAMAAGAKGSPFTVGIVNNEQVRIEGGHLYPAMKSVVEALLRQAQAAGTLIAPTDDTALIDEMFANPPSWTATTTDILSETGTTTDTEAAPSALATTTPGQ